MQRRPARTRAYRVLRTIVRVLFWVVVGHLAIQVFGIFSPAVAAGLESLVRGTGLREGLALIRR